MIWNEIKKQRIRNQIKNKIKLFLKEVIILRKGENVFHEKQEDLFVCKVSGYLHKGKDSLVNFSTDASNLNKNYDEKFLLVVDDDSLRIQEHDYFVLNNVKYEIIDKGLIEDILLDTCLKRME